MSKGSGTRSGLLWEVERLLRELNELPQVLLMENVPQVMSGENIDDFHSWCDFLESKGYKCYAEILNAKDYGVAQNRERAFMVSLLGDYSFQFPEPIPLETCMNDYLEDDVGEKYFVDTENAKELIDELKENGKLENSNFSGTVRGGGWPRITRQTQMGYDTQPLGYYETGAGGVHQSNKVHGTHGVSTTIDTKCAILHFLDDKEHEQSN